jgi:hypothetical protein
MQQTFFDWIKDFLVSIENPEKPNFDSLAEYSKGYIDGSFDTQVYIAEKIRYAINKETLISK